MNFFVFFFLEKKKEKYTNLWTTNVAYARPIFHATMARDRFFHILHVSNFYNKLQAINGDQSTN